MYIIKAWDSEYGDWLHVDDTEMCHLTHIEEEAETFERFEDAERVCNDLKKGYPEYEFEVQEVSKWDEQQREVYNVVEKIITEVIASGKEDPILMSDNLRYIVHQATDNVLMRDHWKVEFNSPLGAESAPFINDTFGYYADWDGCQGHRGTTVVYLPKKDFTREAAGDLEKLVQMWGAISKSEELEDLFDEYTTVDVLNDK